MTDQNKKPTISEKELKLASGTYGSGEGKDLKKEDIKHLDLFHGGSLYENEVSQIASHMDKNPNVIFDIGANVGGFTYRLSERFPESTIYAFEPVKETFELLKENTKNLKNVKVFNFGFSDENLDDVPLGMPYLGDRQHNYGRATMYYDPDLPVVDNVKIVKFSEWCKSNDVYADFMKIDIEGSEYRLLSDADKNGVLTHTDIIYIEINNFYTIRESSQLSKQLLCKKYNIVGDSGFNPENNEPLNYIFKK